MTLHLGLQNLREGQAPLEIQVHHNNTLILIEIWQKIRKVLGVVMTVMSCASAETVDHVTNPGQSGGRNIDRDKKTEKTGVSDLQVIGNTPYSYPERWKGCMIASETKIIASLGAS